MIAEDGQSLIRTHHDRTSRLTRESQTKLGRLREKLLEDLKKLQTNPSASSPHKIQSKEFEYSTDPNVARRQHEEQLGNVWRKQVMQFSEMIQQLIPRLQLALEKEAKATRLDEAIFIRNLIQGLKDGKFLSSRKSG